MQEKLLEFISRYITLSEEEKNEILALDIFRVVKKGTILLKSNQYSNESFFVLQGCIRTYYIIDGEEKTTAFYTEMEGLTPNCVTSKEPSEYYVACTEDCIISVSTPDMEEEVFEKFPKFESLCRVLTEELLSKNQSSFDEFKTSSPEKRYINLMKNKPQLLERVPQIHIASYLGITPQSLSRMRSRLMLKSV